MASNIGTVYANLYAECKRLNPAKTASAAQSEFNKIWLQLKENCAAKKTDLFEKASELLSEYRQRHTQKKATTLLSFFPKVAPSSASVQTTDSRPLELAGPVDKPGPPNKPDSDSPVKDAGRKRGHSQQLESSDEEAVDDPEPKKSILQRNFQAPKQEKCAAEIAQIKLEQQQGFAIKQAGLDHDGKHDAQIKALGKLLKKKETELKLLHQYAIRQKNKRERTKKQLAQIFAENPDLKRHMTVRDEPGRPRIEEGQPELLRVMVDLVQFGAGAQERRRNEDLRSCRTLDDLHKELQTAGFTISRTATYFRLLPKNKNTNEGKRHVVTVPVRLVRPQADLHRSHIDQFFARSTIRDVEVLLSILGPDQCALISQDDKARVAMGVTAANKQTPVLMNVEYRVTLPDHDWVVAARHKLIVSVYFNAVIKRDCMARPEAVTYSGRTYIAIRSGKHCSSTATTHSVDFERLLDVQQEMMMHGGKCKPVLAFSVDGGPDENPRYPKVIAHAIDHFKKLDLDAVFIFSNAPGRSAFNRVERQMAPLSRELSGVLLDHEFFGSHLDGNGKTIDTDLELRNFAHAGEALASIWNGIVVDGHEVMAEYIHPDNSQTVPDLPAADWYAIHVREGQYLLQIVKCANSACCTPARSGLRKILPGGFLPPLYRLAQSEVGPDATPPKDDCHDFAPLLLRSTVHVDPSYEQQMMPYDYFCPSVRSKISDTICRVCGLYFVSKKGAKFHRSQVHRSSPADDGANVQQVRPSAIISRRQNELLCVINERAEWLPEDEVEEGLRPPPMNPDDDSDDLPLIQQLALRMASPFVDEE